MKLKRHISKKRNAQFYDVCTFWNFKLTIWKSLNMTTKLFCTPPDPQKDPVFSSWFQICFFHLIIIIFHNKILRLQSIPFFHNSFHSDFRQSFLSNIHFFWTTKFKQIHFNHPCSKSNFLYHFIPLKYLVSIGFQYMINIYISTKLHKLSHLFRKRLSKQFSPKSAWRLSKIKLVLNTVRVFPRT